MRMSDWISDVCSSDLYPFGRIGRLGAHEEEGHTDPLRRGAGVAVRGGLRVDWFRVLVDLRRLGWTSARVAGEIDMPRTTVDGWKAGAVPRYDPGERLVALWVEVTGNARGDVPRVSPFDWWA